MTDHFHVRTVRPRPAGPEVVHLLREAMTRDWQEEAALVRWCQQAALRVIPEREVVDTLAALAAQGVVVAHTFAGEPRPRYRVREGTDGWRHFARP